MLFSEIWWFEDYIITGLFANNIKIAYSSFLSGNLSILLSHLPELTKILKDGDYL